MAKSVLVSFCLLLFLIEFLDFSFELPHEMHVVKYVCVSYFNSFTFKVSTPGTSRSDISSTHDSHSRRQSNGRYHEDRRRHSDDRYHRHDRDEYETRRQDKNQNSDHGEKRSRYSLSSKRTPGTSSLFFQQKFAEFLVLSILLQDIEEIWLKIIQECVLFN